VPFAARQHGARPQSAPAPELRPTANARGYNYRWQRYTKVFLAQRPLCAECMKEGIVRAADVVDHIEPHRGDEQLFWNPTNHQPMCYSHHGAKSARERIHR
jgi:5-methylcytosine-specific restriction protein A